MKLTGKAKEDFDKWLDTKNYEFKVKSSKCEIICDACVLLELLPDSMKWGVIQDFADSVGYSCDAHIESEMLEEGDYFRRFVKIPLSDDGFVRYNEKTGYLTRQEARTATIEKFNELYNNEKK